MKEEKPAEPEDKSLTYEQFMATKKAVAEDQSIKPREVQIDEKKWKPVAALKKEDDDNNEEETKVCALPSWCVPFPALTLVSL